MCNNNKCVDQKNKIKRICDQLDYFIKQKDFIKIIHHGNCKDLDFINDLKSITEGICDINSIYIRASQADPCSTAECMNEYFVLSEHNEIDSKLDTLNIVFNNLERFPNEIEIMSSRHFIECTSIKIKDDPERYLKIDSKLFNKFLIEFYQRYGDFPSLIKRDILLGSFK